MRQWWTSLIARAIALLLTGLALTSAVVGSVFARIQSNRFRVEVERRGTSMLQMLERHQDLRLALSLHDGRATEEVLGQVLGSNSDIAYLGAVEEKGKVIAWASRGVSERALSNHDLGAESARSDESTSRFTRRVTSDRDSGMGLPGEQSAALGTLVMGILTDQLSGAVARQTFAMVAASGIVLVATFGAFFALLSRRLRRMVRFAEQLAAGDLAAYLTDEAEDEVGRLAAALLELRDNTRAVVAEMRDAAVALESTSEEVFDGATRQLEHSRAQAASAAETERTMDDLRERFVRAQSNAQAVLDLAASSADSSREGEESIEHAVRAVSELGEQIDANTRMLHDLVERTRHVGRIIDAVRDLAAESKMLALNAAIVSSKSGAAATGFTVIAHEVRALADRSQHSTAQVQEILAQILRAIEQATAVVEEGHRRADAGRAVAGRAGESIRRLSDAIMRSSRAATEIANGTREQAEGVGRITGAVQRIARSAEEGAAGIGRLEGASRSIREHSARMRALVERYRTAVLGAVALALLPAAARAELILLTQAEVPQYAQVASAFQRARPDARTVEIGPAPPAVQEGDVVVAVGSKAFELARNAPGTFPVVLAAVLNPDLSGRHAIGGVPMEARPADALAALKALAPSVRRVLVLHPPGAPPVLSEAQAAAARHGVTLDARAMPDLTGLDKTFPELAARADAVWLLADARFARPDVAKYLVAACLQRKIPLIGFLEGMAKVGAALAVAADFEAIGREAARVAGEARHGAIPLRFAPGKLYVNARTVEELNLSGKIPAGAEVIR